MQKLWTFLSYLFHPVIMPTLGTLAVLWCDPNLYIPLNTEKPWLIVLGIVFFCTCLLPLFASWVLLLLGKISSLSHPTESDRRFMLSFTALFFILIYYVFHNIPAIGESLKIFMLGINISIIITLITSLFTPVSFHSVGVGGLLGTILGLMKYTQEHFFPWLAIAFIIVILTSLSRYKLKAHGAFEIYLGLIIGIAVQSLVFFFRIHGA
jgi:hypothetical protein